MDALKTIAQKLVEVLIDPVWQSIGVIVAIVAFIYQVAQKNRKAAAMSAVVVIFLILGIVATKRGLLGPSLVSNSNTLAVMPTSTTQPTATGTPVLPTVSASVLPSPTPVPTPILVSPTPNYSGSIPFAAPDNPGQLNPILGWQPGNSSANSYDLTLNPGTLTVIADAKTDQWEEADTAPLIAYPFKGNFEAQVRVVFSPSKDVQHVGLGVRSIQDQNTWLRITRNFENGTGQCIRAYANKQGESLRLELTPYSGEVAYLKIERRGNLFTMSYSANGSNWVALQKDYVFGMPTDIEIFLNVFSFGNTDGVIAQFSDFQVLAR